MKSWARSPFDAPARRDPNTIDANASRFSDMTDVDLTAAIACGELLALAETYDRHGGVVYGSAHRLCGPEQADDLTIDVFLALWRDPEPLTGPGNTMRARLVRDVHRRAVQAMRAETQGQPVESEMSANDMEFHLKTALNSALNRVQGPSERRDVAGG